MERVYLSVRWWITGSEKSRITPGAAQYEVTWLSRPMRKVGMEWEFGTTKVPAIGVWLDLIDRARNKRLDNIETFEAIDFAELASRIARHAQTCRSSRNSEAG
jgi:hypothetical protein